MERATHLIDDWRSAQIIHGCSVVHTQMHQSNLNRQELIWWEKPARGRYKCNIDTSFSSSLNIISIGMIVQKISIGMFIRDDGGKFVLANILGSPVFMMLQ